MLPALAIALLLTACGGVPQPVVPQTPPSVERALQEAIATDAATTTEEESMEADELQGEDINVELDEALDALENELDETLNEEAAADAEQAELEAQQQQEAEAAADPEPEAAQDATDDAGQIAEEDAGQDEELIDQPIIIE